MNEILAKTNPDVSLTKHSIDVCEKAIELCKASKCNERIIALAAMASLFHDIGKCIPDFQRYIRGGDKKYEHNIVSAKIFSEFVGIEGPGSQYEPVIAKSIMFHSPVDCDCDYIGESVCDDMSEGTNIVEDFVKEFCKYYNSKNLFFKLYIKEEPTETYSSFEYFKPVKGFSSSNKELTFVNGVVRFADVLVSGDLDYNEYINFSFNAKDFVFTKPSFYDLERYEDQCDYVKKALAMNICALYAPTGYGKTFMGLKWMLSDNKKVIWVCPTNLIARGIYKGLVEELHNFGLDKTIKIGLLLTNEWEYGEEYGTKNDIIVTNIDNYTRPIFKSDEKKHMAFNFNYCNVIFDEYHKYIGNDSQLAIFKTALWSRTLSPTTKTLLLSATGNNMFYREINKPEYNFHEIFVDGTKFCNKNLNIQYGDKEKVFTASGNLKDTLIVRNSVSACQNYFSGLDKSFDTDWLCYHSQFTKDDYDKKFNEILKHHSKNCDKELSVCSTNIFTTGINASFRNMVLPSCPIDDIIQTIGRLNRWSEYEDVMPMLVIDNSDENKPNERAAISAKYNQKLCSFEMDYLKKNIPDGVTDLNQLYSVRDAMLNDKEYKAMYEKVFKEWEANSFKSLSELTYSYTSKSKNIEGEMISDKATIRTTNNDKFGKTVKIFIKTTGMKENEYVQADIKEEYIAESTDYMTEILSKNNELAKKYLGKRYHWILKNKMNSAWYSKELLQSKAKNSLTPFLISPKILKYNDVIGLYSTK